MLFRSFIGLLALLSLGIAMDLNIPLSCRLKDQLSDTTLAVLPGTTATPHGSMGQGSVRASATRCPRVKPTITITSTITIGASTVPTSQGFTPILSETYSASFHPNRRRQLPTQSPDPIIVAINPQGQVTTSASELPQSMICGPDTTSSSSMLAAPTSCPALSTVTTTTIATVASSTAYDACTSDNLVNQGFDKGAGHGISNLRLHNLTSTAGSIVATSAYECCAACQMLGCAFGDFIDNPPYPACDLYFLDHCDPGIWLGNTFNYDAIIPPNHGYTVFNGPCGQIVYGGASVCKDYPCK